MTTPRRQISQRALEEAEDFLGEIDRACDEEGITHRDVTFRLDGKETFLSRNDAIVWMQDSVGTGYPRIGFRLEPSDARTVVVNLAADGDPDSQYHP